MGNGGCFSFEAGAVPMKDKGKVNMLDSEIKILGDLHVAMEDINQDALTDAEKIQIAMGNYGAVLPTSIHPTDREPSTTALLRTRNCMSAYSQVQSTTPLTRLMTFS